MNVRALRSNLEEAAEELAFLIARIDSPRGLDEADLEARLEHAYSHLNTAWRARDVSDDALQVASDVEWDSWQKFPRDEPFEALI